MTKGKVILIIAAVLLTAAVAAAVIFVRSGEPAPTDATTTAPTTEATTQATDAPTEATEEKQLYWVFAQGGLWVRQGPSTDYVLVGSLDDGETIEVLAWQDGWAYIEEPVKGWCSGDYIHKLGWYKDVKTPEGTPPQDNSLKGKWVHVATPAEQDGVVTCTAGIYRLGRRNNHIWLLHQIIQCVICRWHIGNLNIIFHVIGNNPLLLCQRGQR